MPPRRSTFNPALNRELYASGYTQSDLAKAINRSQTYVSSRLTGDEPWSMDEVYMICNLFELDLKDIATYFPRTEASK